MRNGVVGYVMLFLLVGAACSKAPQPLEQRKVTREVGADGKTISVDLGSAVKLEMVLIPAGEFLMGSPREDHDAFSNEEPQQRVRITRPFYLGKYPVTQEQWRVVMGDNPSDFKGPKNPVEQVSWNDCQRFLRKLNAMSRPGGGVFQLPSEAQWEYACRAGSATRYCFGDNEPGLGEYAWYEANSGGQTHPVGGKKPNAWGLYDMLGNVWEWCADWYEAPYRTLCRDGYQTRWHPDDPAGPAEGSLRVLRGGSWRNPARGCRSANRDNARPGSRCGSLGFRVGQAWADTGNALRLAEAIKLQPIAVQIVEPGKLLSVVVTVKDAEKWNGKLHYDLAPNCLAGATIDSKAGVFTWTPLEDQKIGKYDLTVEVRGPWGQTDRTMLTITVARQISFDLGGGVKLEMILIPAGDFIMGSPDSDLRAQLDEKPPHRVRITKPFYLGKYLVTQEQWEAVMGNNPSRFKGAKNPVEQVTWDDCRLFLDKLNAKFASQSGRYRLPTEAQWEYACRAGSTTYYPFGDDWRGLGGYAWHGDESRGTTHPVGGKKPNAWGLYDMIGNVWEWCADWYGGEYYAGSPTRDPTGPATGSLHVCRGGSFDPTTDCRSAERSEGAPGGMAVARKLPPGRPLGHDLGFRVARIPADK